MFSKIISGPQSKILDTLMNHKEPITDYTIRKIAYVEPGNLDKDMGYTTAQSNLIDLCNRGVISEKSIDDKTYYILNWKIIKENIEPILILCELEEE